MTLLIAILLMRQSGIEHPAAYIGACALWVVHTIFHDSPSSDDLARKIVEKLRKR